MQMASDPEELQPSVQENGRYVNPWPSWKHFPSQMTIMKTVLTTKLYSDLPKVRFILQVFRVNNSAF